MSGPAEPVDFAAAHLNNLRVFHEESGNPVAAWWAIDFCLNELPTTPLPDWCVSVLAEAARNIMRLSDGRHFDAAKCPPALSETRDVSHPVDRTTEGKIDWNKWVGMVPQALGFTSKGRNNFKNARVAFDKRRAAVNHDQHRRLLGQSPTEAQRTIREQLGLSDADESGGDVRAILREGKRMLRGKPGKPRG